MAAFVQPLTRSCLRVEMTVTPVVIGDVAAASEPFWILVEDCDGESLLYAERFLLKKKFQKP